MTAERPTAERPTADGTVEKEPDGSITIRFDRRLRHPIERVWQALTDPDELRSWWGDTKLELVKGGPFQLRWRNTDEHGDVATLDGTITSIDPPRLLEISADWGTAATGQPGTRTHLTWELEPDGDHTLLHFTNKVEAPAREVTTAAGWHLHLDALATILSGGEVDIAHPEDLFAPIHQAYTDRYGPGPEPGDNATPQASEADSSSSARRRGREPTRSPRGSPG
jgi:uncharacterized protein YndB with AHSA1/START domain